MNDAAFDAKLAIEPIDIRPAQSKALARGGLGMADTLWNPACIGDLRSQYHGVQGLCWLCFSDSSIALRNCSTAATGGASSESLAVYRQTGDVFSGSLTPPR